MSTRYVWNRYNIEKDIAERSNTDSINIYLQDDDICHIFYGTSVRIDGDYIELTIEGVQTVNIGGSTTVPQGRYFTTTPLSGNPGQTFDAFQFFYANGSVSVNVTSSTGGHQQINLYCSFGYGGISTYGIGSFKGSTSYGPISGTSQGPYPPCAAASPALW